MPDMSKSKPPGADDHWKRLAAELGLEMDPEPEPLPPPDAESTAAPPDEPPPSVGEEVVSETLGVWTTDSHEFVMAPTVEEVREPEVLAVESERDEAAADEFGEASPEPKDEERPRRRRRSRRRKSGGDAPAESAASTDQSQDDDDSPVEIVKDWNIPSWNDLIASLYRPDR
jgi:hypothetical protein